MPALIIVTGNSNKAKEIKEILRDIDVVIRAIDAPEIQSFSLEEIVKAKAEFAQKECGGVVTVEDIAIDFDVLKGFPGPFIKFWHHNVGYDLVLEIAGKMGNNRASMRCGVGYADGERFFYVEGKAIGQIVAPKGEGSFSPYFLADGQTRTFGEMTSEEKNALSHRGIGWRAMREKLEAEGIL